MKPTSESLSAQETRNLSVAEGNCVSARAGGEQSEAKDQPQTKVNSFRPCRLASKLGKGICGGKPPGVSSEACGASHTVSRDITRSMRTDRGGGVFGVGMERRLHGVSQDCSALWGMGVQTTESS